MRYRCSCCGERVEEGYWVEDFTDRLVFCSDDCLHTRLTDEEYLTAYDEGWAFWTSWEDDEVEETYPRVEDFLNANADYFIDLRIKNATEDRVITYRNDDYMDDPDALEEIRDYIVLSRYPENESKIVCYIAKAD